MEQRRNTPTIMKNQTVQSLSQPILPSLIRKTPTLAMGVKCVNGIVKKKTVDSRESSTSQSADQNDRENMMEIINSEILPLYEIDVPGMNVEDDTETFYSCSACKEKFFFPSGLDAHVMRKSLQIFFYCPNCMREHLFYNRCTLIQHLETHGIKPCADYLKKFIRFQTLNEEECTSFLKSYPELGGDRLVLSELRTSPTPPINGYESTDDDLFIANGHEDNAESVDKSLVNGLVQPQQSATISEDDDIEIIGETCTSRKKQAPIEKICWCPICNKDFQNPEMFSSHLRSSEISGMESGSVFTCPVDNTSYWSLCGYVYHKNSFHESKLPFICQHCGKSFLQFSDFETHTKIECFQLSKRLRYKCKQCTSVLLENEPSIIDHMEKQHLKLLTQCARCPQAFATTQWFLKHLQAFHELIIPDELEVTCEVSTITVEFKNEFDENLLKKKDFEETLKTMTKSLFQCQLCQIIFYTKTAYLQHLRVKKCSHTKPFYVYECPICSETYSSSPDLKNHYVIHSAIKLASGQLPSTTVPNASQPTGLKTESETKKVKSLSSSQEKTNFPYAQKFSLEKTKNCQYCSQSFTIKAIRRHEDQCSKTSKVSPVHCLVCKKNFHHRINLIQHGFTHLNSGKTICLHCNNREILPLDPSQTVTFDDQAEALQKHLLTEHASKINLPYFCPLCKKMFHQQKLVEQHFVDHHSCELLNLPMRSSETGGSSSTSPSKKKKLNGKIRTDIVIDKDKDSYFCPLCMYKKFSDKNAFFHHMEITHKIKRDKSVELDSIFRKRERLVNLKNCNLPAKALKSKSTKNFPRRSPRLTSISNGSSSDARDSNGNIKCLKCKDFVTKDEDTFLAHVNKSHVWTNETMNSLFKKGKELSTFWCAECNKIFMAQRSLVMHLKTAHEFLADRLKEYLEKTGYDGKKPLRPNQCEVCYMEFSSPEDHQMHFRTHGMAYLRLRQKRSSSS